MFIAIINDTHCFFAPEHWAGGLQNPHWFVLFGAPHQPGGGPQASLISPRRARQECHAQSFYSGALLPLPALTPARHEIIFSWNQNWVHLDAACGADELPCECTTVLQCDSCTYRKQQSTHITTIEAHIYIYIYIWQTLDKNEHVTSA